MVERHISYILKIFSTLKQVHNSVQFLCNDRWKILLRFSDVCAKFFDLFIMVANFYTMHLL